LNGNEARVRSRRVEMRREWGLHSAAGKGMCLGFTDS
jgi:hypothetical protein